LIYETAPFISFFTGEILQPTKNFSRHGKASTPCFTALGVILTKTSFRKAATPLAPSRSVLIPPSMMCLISLDVTYCFNLFLSSEPLFLIHGILESPLPLVSIQVLGLKLIRSLTFLIPFHISLKEVYS